MKKYLSLISLLAVTFVSCTNELENIFTAGEVTTINVSTKEFNTSSRTSIDNSNYSVKWSDGDIIGIFPEEGDQISFKINSGMEGSTSALFNGGGWALKNNETYYAYYPYTTKNTIGQNNYKNVTVNYDGQIQHGNNSTDHLATVDYMYAESEAYNGNVNFAFNHASSLLCLQLDNIPEGTVIKRVVLSTDGESFTHIGALDCSNGNITSLQSADSLSINLEQVTVDSNQPLKVWLMTAPLNLSEKTLRIKAIDDADKVYSISVPGMNYEAGKVYFLSTAPDPTPYVVFESAEDQILKLSKSGGETHLVEGTLYYSVGDSEWKTIVPGESVTFGGNHGDLRLRGKLPSGTAKTTDMGVGQSYHILFENYTDVACHGDIRTLVDYENYQDIEGDHVSFWFLFEDCYQLTSIPELPFKRLGSYCYSGLFRGCSRLVAPLERLDVDEMNYGCCYSMFSKCYSLTKAPELPAMTLSEACYQWMFGECISLVEAPELPAIELKDYCYKEMFTGCTSLKYIKMMGITDSNIDSQRSPFYSWTDNVPSGGTFIYNSDAAWFDSKRSSVIPSGWTYQAVDTTPYLTFSAESLQIFSVASVGTASTLKYNMYYSLDHGKTWTSLNNKDFIPFGGDKGDLMLRAKNSVGTAKDVSNYLQFKFLIDDVSVNCSGDMRTLVDYTNYHKPSYSNVRFCHLFKDCKVLKTAPKLSLPEGFGSSNASYCYYNMFKGCSSLAEAPELPQPTYFNSYAYYGMFSDCTNLIKAPALPVTRMEDHCYMNMFYNCKSLEVAPELPATILANSCYECMFMNCTSLKQKAKTADLYWYYDDNDEDKESYPNRWNTDMYTGCTF